MKSPLPARSVTAIALLSAQRAIDSMPDDVLRSEWIARPHGTAFYYLALSELVYERLYDAARLIADREEVQEAIRVHRAEGEPYHAWVAHGAY